MKKKIHLGEVAAHECARARARRVAAFVCGLVVVSGLVALFAVPHASAAEGSGVALNEVNCTGEGWVELINRGDTEVSLANWLLTDDRLDADPPRDDHRMRLGHGAVLAPGGRVVVGALPFELSCGDDTLRLADADGALVDELTLPVPAASGSTFGRIPEGTGEWTVTLPTPGTANAIATDAQKDDPAWLYDPLEVTEVDLEATPAALAELASAPDEYVEARIALRHGAETYGPYRVGLKLKGHGSFRRLDGKAAFKVKFGHVVAGQRFRGLKALTLNNMVQDPSMIAEATSSLLFAATGVPSARVGYAYVRLNGAEYGLYADVETVDSALAKRLFTSTKHLYEGEYGADVIPGRTAELQVQEGSATDRADLEALASAATGSTTGWWDRMQPVADLDEITRALAAEHYIGHADGYSIFPGLYQPNNYYLHDGVTGRFSLIPSGTDQTWAEHTAFGVYGNGVLMRQCIADVTCRELYVDALRKLADNPAVGELPAQARRIRAAIAPWRLRDPRLEQTAPEGDAQADAKIATMEARTGELPAWLTSPSFFDAAGTPAPPAVGGGADGGAPPPQPPQPAPPVAAGGGAGAPPAPQPPQTAPAAPANVGTTLAVSAGPSPQPSVRPLLGKPVGLPAKPVAGHRFTFSVPVSRSDTHAPLETGRCACDPSVGGRILRHAESAKHGKVRLSLVIPATARGHVLRIRVKFTAFGRAAAHTYAYAVH